MGILIDKIGRRVLLIIISAVILLGAHLTTMFLAPSCPATSYNEVIALVLVGIGFSIYAAALWPSIAYVVDAKTVGSAYGICTALQNAGLATAPTIGGAINTATVNIDYGYKWEAFFWVCLMIIAIFLDLLLFYVDGKSGWILHRVNPNQTVE